MAPRRGPDDDLVPWRWPGYPPSAPKLPPPEHGIKVKTFGTTWWGERWVVALARFGASYTARLGRGRSYARQGRVHDLRVRDGVVSASVTGSRPVPYRVTLRLKPLPAASWQHAIQAMAAKARFAAELLAGQMPRDIDEAFVAVKASLFPERGGDLVTGCTCPDHANPCKHVAALHYVLAEALDRNPFLLFELRGRTKASVLSDVRRVRAGAAATPARRSSKRPEAAAGVAVKPADRARYETFRAPLTDLRISIGAPAAEGAILRQLGVPRGWSLPLTPLELLQPAVAAAARLAREIGLGSTDPADRAATGSEALS
jgi:uncharacterized Zn finger protein